MELTAVGKSLAEAKIQRGIFEGDALSPLQFAIAMSPLNDILKKFTRSYKLTKSQEKLNHLIYMGDIKIFAKKEKELEAVIAKIRIYGQNIGKEYEIEKLVILIMRSGKRQVKE